MDEIKSKSSDAAASRKRRSSILKSQRTSRTPLSELEFNVTTPTDTLKSRRVSFSKRTGVAEFVTNEATTTLNVFFEEHCKSLESSGNDSAIKATRPSIGHIGKHIFNQQCEGVEYDHFMETHKLPGLNVHSSLDVNFTQQLAALECTGDDRKLVVPPLNCELSTITDPQSKHFMDDLSVPGMGEMSGVINVNFSAVHTIQGTDDLEEIQENLERIQMNSSSQGRFLNKGNLSDYIEIDINNTDDIKVQNEESDMSITETVHSPKVQEVAKICTVDKKSSTDWEADKENIVINPYVAPRESVNFAINEEIDKVLVFDGKRLTLQTDKDDSKSYRKTLIPNAPIEKTPQIKPVLIDVNDDLPNFIDVQPRNTETSILQQQKMGPYAIGGMGKDCMNPALFSDEMISFQSEFCGHEKTFFCGNETGNISITQALPATIISGEKVQQRHTIFYENDSENISMTQAISSNLNLFNNVDNGNEKRKTVIFENDNGDVSMTEVVPPNIIADKSQEKRHTILFNNNNADVSITQALTGNIVQEAAEHQFIGNESDLSNISIIHKNKTVVYENDDNISNTQAISKVILPQDELVPQHRKTIIYEDNSGHISVTQAIPSNIIESEPKAEHISVSYDIKPEPAQPKNLYESERTNIPDRIRTIAYEKDFESSTNQVINNLEENNMTDMGHEEKRKTRVYTNNDDDISKTRVISSNIVLTGSTVFISDKKQTLLSNSGSMVEKLSNIALLNKTSVEDQSNTFGGGENVHDNQNTESDEIKKDVIFNGGVITKNLREKIDQSDRRQTILFENDVDKSITHPMTLPDLDVSMEGVSVVNNNLSDKLLLHTTTTDKCKKENRVLSSPEEGLSKNQDVIVYQADATHSHNTSNPISEKMDLNKVTSNETINHDNDMIDMQSSQNSNVKNDTQINITNDKVLIKKYSHLDTPIIIPKKDADVAIKKIKNTVDEMNDSILDDLLDMSIDDGFDDKNLMVNVESKQIIKNDKPIYDEVKVSNESMFYITKDSDEEIQTEKSELRQSKEEIKSIKTSDEMMPIKNKSLSLEYTEKSHGIADLPKKLSELKGIMHTKESPLNSTHYENILGLEVNNELYKDAPRETIHVSNIRKSIKNADDTNDLLQLLSDFTDNKVSDYIEEEDDKEPIVIKRHIDLENKSENINNARSNIGRKLSMVLSRDDILNNISMAHATLQKSKHEFDVTFDTTQIETPDTNPHMKKSVRMSDDVVKTLHFDDDTESDTSMKSEKLSPLKKTAFGETSYMKDNKLKVIPSYLEDVSDEIKELMHDLVKPTADSIPFEKPGCGKELKNIPSTRSTQVQANIADSSQIDIHADLYSNSTSTCDIDEQVLANKGALDTISVLSQSHKIVSKHVTTSVSEPSVVEELVSIINISQNFHKSHVKHDTMPGRVLVFDHHNPLNNVLLAPLDDCKTHKYNPIKSDETLCASEHSNSVQMSINDKDKEFKVARLSQHYNMENCITLSRSAQPSGDSFIEKCADTESTTSNWSKPASMDQSIDVKMTEVKDIDVNTVIAMKQNKDLLDASSSLTLVDDAFVPSVIDVAIDLKSSESQDQVQKKGKSPIKISEQSQQEISMSIKIDSDVTSNDEQDQPLKHRPKKRSYSPTKRRQSVLANLEITPKPTSKMQKLSKTPEAIENQPLLSEKVKLTTELDEKVSIDIDMNTELINESVQINNKSRHRKENSPRSLKNSITGTAITVHQLMTEYNIEKPNLDEDRLKEEKAKASKGRKSDMSNIVPKTVSQPEIEENKSIQGVSSFTSSKNLKEAREERSGFFELQQTSTSSLGSRNCIIWRPEHESRSGVNVISEIDKLPFMGSRECEWENCSGDVWSFRLLHGRCRMTVRLGKRHDNASWSHVRPDVPLEAIALEIAHHDKKNSVAALCVRFGAEAMRYECGRGGGAAGGVPALLRRCAAVARLALRWGRAMHDAQRRLAYTLSDGDRLALKVANVPLRSVWEVRMRLELMVEDARQSPWPRAGDVCVECVVSEVRVGDAELRRALGNVPADWGHVPRTLWRIFKHLKYKTREDEFLDFVG